MPSHECPRCKFIFNKKSTYTFHIKRKHPCKIKICDDFLKLLPKTKKSDSSFECPECMALFTRQDNLTRHKTKYCHGNNSKDDINNDNDNKTNNNDDIKNDLDDVCEKLPQKKQLIIDISRIDNQYLCDHCKTTFTRKDSLTRHVKNRCKVKKATNDNLENIYNMLFQLKQDNEELKHTNEELKKKVDNIENKTNTINHNTINGNINNTINNNHNYINVIAFGKEEISFPDDSIKYLLSKGFTAVELTVKNTNFSEKKPQFHNVYLPNIRGDFAMVYNGEKWGLKDLNYVLQQIYNDKKYYLEDKFDEFIDSLSKSSIKSFRRFLKKEEKDPNCSKKIIKNIKAMLHNNKAIPMKTITRNKLIK
jgi:uncharacterized C2H2 Zn-finger protein